MVNANEFKGNNDSEIINNAIRNRHSDGIVIIPPREQRDDKERNYWLLDSAILLPQNTVVILHGCKIKLSDNCRDNFFRTANCGMGIEFPERISNVHIRGEGLCILEGADRPRATGDSEKELHFPCPHLKADACRVSLWIPEERRKSANLEFGDIHGYSVGTDAGNNNESQYGDWRGIGILFANVDSFSVSGIKLVKTHGWGISMEECSNGRVERIVFDSCMSREIDGMLMNMENQDGVNLRNGCHHITISDVSGMTGDDVVALTAVAGDKYIPGGSLCSTHVMHTDWSKRSKDIHDIIIRNITAHSYMGYPVRLLPASTHIYNVIIDGIIDSSTNRSTIITGSGGLYGENYKDGLRYVTISNVICNSLDAAITVKGYLADSSISNVINRNPDGKLIIHTRENGIENVNIY